jgi:hypothetical protein
MNHDEETRDVEARTTPGHDPRVEQLAEEQEQSRAAEPAYGEAGTAREGAYGDERMHEEAPMHEGVHEGAPMREGAYSDRTMQERETQQPVAGQPYDRGVGSDGPMLEGYRGRLADAQARFIDDPRGAVQEAHSVVKEAVDRFMDSINQDGGGEGDTERMRLTMQRYREIFDRLAETSH